MVERDVKSTHNPAIDEMGLIAIFVVVRVGDDVNLALVERGGV